MASKVKVGTKLLVVLVPLAVVAVLAAGFIALERQALAEDHNQDLELIDLASAQAAFAENIATESVYAVIGSGGDEFAIAEFQESAVSSNEAWEELKAQSQDVAGRDDALYDRLATLDEEFTGNIADRRAEILAGTADPDVVQSGYDAVDEALVAVASATIDLANEIETASGLGTSQDLSVVLGAVTDIGRSAAATAAQSSTDQPEPELREEMGAYRQAMARFLLGADTDLNERFESVVSTLDDGDAMTALEEGTLRQVLDSGVANGEGPLPLGAALASWQQDLLDETYAEIDGLHVDASESARNLSVVALLVFLLALPTSILVTRLIVRPLRQLATHTERLASQDLPKLIGQVHKFGTSEPFAHYALPVSTNDEYGSLAKSVNSISELAISNNAEQSARSRANIKGVFVQLARRNQGLLDQQIGVIDELRSCSDTSTEREGLLRLDHLATRLRRNAESLLVIAGVEQPRRHGTSIGLIEVLRVAVGEVEDSARIELTSIEPVTVSGEVAVDLAHLLSELLENATQFSAAGTKVEIRAGFGDGNGFKITVSDRGIGMVPAQCSAANDALADPALADATLNRSLGLSVIAHLASRIEAKVTLFSKAGTGTVATVLVPMTAINPSGLTEQTAPANEAASSGDDLPRRNQPAEAHQGSQQTLTAIGTSRSGRSAQAVPVEATEPSRELGPVNATAGRSTPPVQQVQETQSETPPGFKDLAEFTHARGVSFPEPGTQHPKPISRGVARGVTGTTTPASKPSSRPATPAKRSPEEVRHLLERYRGDPTPGRNGTPDKGEAGGEER